LVGTDFSDEGSLTVVVAELPEEEGAGGVVTAEIASCCGAGAESGTDYAVVDFSGMGVIRKGGFGGEGVSNHC
jgi:hypothetical protein